MVFPSLLSFHHELLVLTISHFLLHSMLLILVRPLQERFLPLKDKQVHCNYLLTHFHRKLLSLGGGGFLIVGIIWINIRPLVRATASLTLKYHVALLNYTHECEVDTCTGETIGDPSIHFTSFHHDMNVR